MGKFRDLTGERFGGLTVVSRTENVRRANGRTRTAWNCICDCGNTCVVNADNLTRGMQVSCGCYQKVAARNANLKHDRTNTRLYNVWSAMKSRCSNPNVPTYNLYGGRGIRVCDDWLHDFNAFQKWAFENGYDESAPRGQCTIDRIDCDGDYSPENCRIISQQAQMNNVRYNRKFTYNSETHTAAEWGRIMNIDPLKILNRVDKLGWTIERALTTT